MGHNNRRKVLRVFYESSDKVFTVREVSGISGVPRATVHKILVDLKTEGMINSEGRASLSSLFLVRKVNYYVELLFSSGLVDFLVKELNPSAIVLFGSVSSGHSVLESDIDLFIEASVDDSLNLNMKKFEKKIGHKIELFVESKVVDLKKKNPHLFNNVVNGIKLYGVLDFK